MAKQIYVDGDIEDWSEVDWADYLEEKAEKLAEEKIKENRKYGSKVREGDLEKYTQEYKRRMLKAYPFEKLDDAVYAAFDNQALGDGVKWLDGWKDKDPMAVAKEKEFKEYAPYLAGNNNEGNDWYSLNSEQLKKIGGEFGFKTGTSEGFAKFLDKLAGYQEDFDRAKLVKEFQENQNPVETVAYPLRTKAIENAIANGTDLSKAQLVGLTLLDAGIDMGQFAAPSLNITKSRPVLNAALDAGVQGALEAGRQFGAGEITEGSVEPDYVEAPVTSLTAGLTRPAIFGTTQGLLSGLTGPEWMKFRRGLMGSTRAGNPVVAERAALAKNIDNYNKGVRDAIEQVAFTSGSPYAELFNSFTDKGVNRWMTLADADVALRANLAPKLREAFQGAGMDIPLTNYAESGLGKYKGIPMRANNVFRKIFPKRVEVPFSRIEAKAGIQPMFLNKKEILKQYDNMYPVLSTNVKNGITTVNAKTTPEQPHMISPALKAKDVLKLSGEQKDALSAVIPNKMSELTDRDWKYNAGMNIGTAINDFGGRVEPAFKLNLLNPFKDSPLATKDDSYKKTQWYKKLDVKSRKVIDEAFKKKEDEETTGELE